MTQSLKETKYKLLIDINGLSRHSLSIRTCIQVPPGSNGLNSYYYHVTAVSSDSIGTKFTHNEAAQLAKSRSVVPAW